MSGTRRSWSPGGWSFPFRHIRFQYPTAIFDDAYFEIDNEGHPYWIVPTVCYHGVGIRREINGVIIVDPITGKSKKYNVVDVPTWVDHVYSPELVIEQVNDWGKYKNGFINSLFGQKNVVATTEGYNYTVMNDDVYLYTGITSVSSDEANIGFILANLRTKETVFYSIPGAEEYSAMASAEGQVQQMSYIATFPLLINLKGKPTYLVSLKDNAGLVKMYAFIDVQDYQNVVVTDYKEGIEKAAENYLNNFKGEKNTDSDKETKVTITNLKEVTIDGNTYYYFESGEDKYRVSIKVNPSLLPFIKEGDEVNIFYTEGNVREISKIEIV